MYFIAGFFLFRLLCGQFYHIIFLRQTFLSPTYMVKPVCFSSVLLFRHFGDKGNLAGNTKGSWVTGFAIL